jgi:large subunit ribosomal protein L22
MPYQALYRYARISPRKLRRVVDLVRGHYADDALDILRQQPHRGARMVEKVLKSALANAEDLRAANLKSLRVVEIRVDEGPRMKRLRPLFRGMATVIQRRFSHIHVVLDY